MEQLRAFSTAKWLRHMATWDSLSASREELLAGAAALEAQARVCGLAERLQDGTATRQEAEAVLGEAQAQREGEIARLRAALTALVAYEPVLSVGDAYDYCAYCTGRSPQHLDWCPWTAARAALSPAGTAKEEESWRRIR